MKKLHKTIGLLLAAVFVLTAVSACAMPAAGTPAPAAPAQEAAAEEAAPAAAEAEAPAAEAAEEAAAWEGDIDTIEVALMANTSNEDAFKRVNDAANAITEKNCGVHADITFYSFGDYLAQIGLMMASGEPVDVIGIAFGPASFTSLTSAGQLMDITDLLQEEGKEMYDLMADYIMADSINGRIFALPPYRNYASSLYIIMRTDILEELGLLEKAQNMKTWTEYEEIMAAVKENIPNISPVCAGSNQVIMTTVGDVFAEDAFADVIQFDNLGDSLRIIDNQDGHITLLPLNENKKKEYTMVKKWYDNDWINKDSIFNTNDSQDTLMKNGVTFSSIQVSEIGIEIAKQQLVNYPVTCVEICQDLLTSTSVNKFGCGIPVKSDDPEAAMRWINEFYTNPDLENILTFGVEGSDYVVKDGEATYPDGVDAMTVGFHNSDFVVGNYFNCLPWEGQGADFRAEAYENLKAAPISPYLGFAVDQSELANAMSALNAIDDEFRGQLCGGMWTDEVYDKYLSQLNAADVDSYLQAYEDQLNAWIAATGE